MCFVWTSEQTAIISLYNINWLVCITETKCEICVLLGCYSTCSGKASLTFPDNLSVPSPNSPEGMGSTPGQSMPELWTKWHCDRSLSLPVLLCHSAISPLPSSSTLRSYWKDKQDRICRCKRNIKTRSRDHSCCGKSVSVHILSTYL